MSNSLKFNLKGDQSRIVRHFHFTTWPDFGVPEPPKTLVKFVRAFRERCSPDSNKPIIVHCSAGVGRSGTFIALDRILQRIHKYDSVDIFGIVYEMRKERVWMVQNEVSLMFRVLFKSFLLYFIDLI
jgi:cadherin 5 type 2 (VE-cadherin)